MVHNPGIFELKYASELIREVRNFDMYEVLGNPV